MNEKNEIPMFQEIYDPNTIEGLVGILQGRLAEKNYLEALKFAENLQAKMVKINFILPFNLKELVDVFKKLDQIVAHIHNPHMITIYNHIKDNILHIIVAIKTMETGEIKNKIIHLKKYLDLLIKDDNIRKAIAPIVNAIGSAIYNEENIKNINNLSNALTAKEFKLSKNLAKELTKKNTLPFPFNLKKLIHLYSEFDSESKDDNLNELYRGLKILF
jgi:hypothetical protein